MSVFFTSDLHLHHKLVMGLRAIPQHDDHVLAGIDNMVGKRDKLFILGDLAFSLGPLRRLRELKCQNISILLGNHDHEKPEHYLEIGKLIGPVKYKGFCLSHVPIHPQELQRCRANIHGHVHITGFTDNPGLPLEGKDPIPPSSVKLAADSRYFNVNLEFHQFEPVPFDLIDSAFRREE